MAPADAELPLLLVPGARGAHCMLVEIRPRAEASIYIQVVGAFASRGPWLGRGPCPSPGKQGTSSKAFPWKKFAS